MKKVLFFAAAAMTLLASCSKVENNPAAADQEINFVVATQNAATKAAFPTTDSFFSYAYYADGLAGKTAGDEMYSQQQVTFQTSYWSTTPNKYYWPKAGKLTFLACAPYVADSESAARKSLIPDAVTISSMVWNEPKVYSENADLLYAEKAIEKTNSDDTNASGYYGVSTIFKHAASMVEFNVVLAYDTDSDATTPTTWEVTLKSLTVSDVYTTGKLTLESTAMNTAWATPTWSNLGNKATVVNYTTPGSITTTAISLGGARINVPQTIPADAKVTGKVDIVTKRGGVEFNKVEDYEFSALLNTAKNGTDAVTAWQPGYKYVYTIKITPADSRDDSGNPTDKVEDALIKFDPTVSDWTTVNCTLVM